MKFVNRISLIITPKQPMHQWLVDSGFEDVPSLLELTGESSCYLVDEPEQEQPLDTLIEQLIQSHYTTIWQSELSVWDEFLDLAPQLSDSTQFKQWFNVKLSGLTFDLATAPLMLADVEGV